MAHKHGASIMSFGHRLLSKSSKLTGGPLLDKCGRIHDYLRISLTERCNLRCVYCMPAEGVQLNPRSKLLTVDELTRLVRVLAAQGVRRVRLTGGEPTLRGDLPEVIQEISAVPGIERVAMTTNGLTLTRRLPSYQRAGLAAINVSMDSLKPDRYERLTRRPGAALAKALAGIDLALQLGYSPVKVNTVLLQGVNVDEVSDFVRLTKDRDVHIRFIEFMPFAGNGWDASRLVSEREVLEAARSAYPSMRPMPPKLHSTATLWEIPGHIGRVGFISSMTRPFCSSCNRLRLTADGNLKVCLLGGAEVSLRDAIRSGASDEELAQLVRDALSNKKPQHADLAFRHEESLANGKSTHDPYWRITKIAARQYCTHAPDRPNTEQTNQEGEKKEETNKHNDTEARVTEETNKHNDTEARMTHIDEEGRAKMVDVSHKDITERNAEAECYLEVSSRVLKALRDTTLPKGDALTVAEMAGTLAAKKTSDLIPLCHPLPLQCAKCVVTLPKTAWAGRAKVKISCTVKVIARTGAEMEALTGASIGALALYDMCKSLDKDMRIGDLKVVYKNGGKSGFPSKKYSELPEPKMTDSSPSDPKEPFAPTNMMNF